MIASAWLALLAPAGAVVTLATLGTRISRRQAGLLVSAAILLSFLASAYGFVRLLLEEAEERSHLSTLYTWLSAGSFEIGFEILVDPLSMLMMLIVSGVGSLIVAYATGYMRNDDEERRYHAYKALFVFSMLLLVMAGNLLLLLAGWGLVGLSSYLLIGFWHRRPEAVRASKKAFVVNAIGDVTFMIALFILAMEIGAVDYPTVFGAAPEALGQSTTVSVLVALGLLGGAVAKSAQIPLHTWLPDAMEGPTPVSALIHAATMVTAGVYLIVRNHVLFELAPAILHLAAILGAVTLVYAGIVALAQTDIKRVIAYSTMSQIGYMFVGAGIGAYSAGMFHLMTHAFFKALLFLAAGLVIHALSNEQDIRKMGGRGRELPRTTRAFLIGSLALVGIPPFAGFFSKDEILASTLAAGGVLGVVLFVLGIAGAFLTAVYAFRLYFVVFRGRPSDYVRTHLHRERFEGPLSMVWPVAILAVLSLVGGFVQVPSGWHAITTWLEPVVQNLAEPVAWMEALAALLAVGVAAAGILLAWRLYGVPSDLPARIRARVPRLADAVDHEAYVNETYDLVFSEPTVQASVQLTRRVERPILLASLGGVGTSLRGLARWLSETQTGLLRLYALLIAGSLALLALVYLVVR